MVLLCPVSSSPGWLLSSLPSSGPVVPLFPSSQFVARAAHTLRTLFRVCFTYAAFYRVALCRWTVLKAAWFGTFWRHYRGHRALLGTRTHTLHFTFAPFTLLLESFTALHFIDTFTFSFAFTLFCSAHLYFTCAQHMAYVAPHHFCTPHGARRVFGACARARAAGRTARACRARAHALLRARALYTPPAAPPLVARTAFHAPRTDFAFTTTRALYTFCHRHILPRHAPLLYFGWHLPRTRARARAPPRTLPRTTTTTTHCCRTRAHARSFYTFILPLPLRLPHRFPSSFTFTRSGSHVYAHAHVPGSPTARSQFTLSSILQVAAFTRTARALLLLPRTARFRFAHAHVLRLPTFACASHAHAHAFSHAHFQIYRFPFCRLPL